MSDIFESMPEPSDEELLMLSADDYLSSIAANGEDEARKRFSVKVDLQHEIRAQVELINALIEDYAISDDPAIPSKIEEAKLDLGRMLVDKLNLDDF